MDNALIVEIKIWKGADLLHQSKAPVQESIVWDLYNSPLVINDVDVFKGYTWTPQIEITKGEEIERCGTIP